MKKTKTLLFVVTEDWYFYSHRRPMIKAAQEEGFHVTVITNIDKHKKNIENLGVTVIPFSFKRRSLNPVKALLQIQKLTKIYKKEQPTIVHHIAMKPILFGSIAAWFAKVPVIINAFAGLGYVFNARHLKARIIRAGLWLPFFVLLRRKNTNLLFQNKDDLNTLRKQKLTITERTHIIRGSGIDLSQYPVMPFQEPAPDFICVFAGRMINIKGLPTLKEAFALLEKQHPHIHLHLYGNPDPENPGSWSLQDLQQWEANSPNVLYKGHAENMATIWGNTHAAIQASYGGEGVPKSLLEAASCSRAIVATNVPGCREVVEDGKNGFLVPAYDAPALANALIKLADNISLCHDMGIKSRQIVEGDMSAERVQEQTAALYRKLTSH